MTKAKFFEKIHVYCSPEFHDKIKGISFDHETSISSWCRMVLEEKVKEEESQTIKGKGWRFLDFPLFRLRGHSEIPPSKEELEKIKERFFQNHKL